jgi:hypothetical protein
MYIRTHAHSEAKHFFQQAGYRALVLFLLAISIVSAASAQKGKKNRRNADAVLHLNVYVVPVVMAPRPVQNISSGIVTYNVPMNRPSVEMTETTTLLPGSLVGSSGSGSGAVVVLKTLTIVTK